MNRNLVYIANSGDAPYGITVAELDYASGTLSIVQHVTEISECHYLNLHPNGRFLLATTMDNDVEVVSLAIDSDGKLRKVSSQSAGGSSPAYVCVDASERNVLMINYIVGATRGNIRLYPIDSDGMIGSNSEMIEHDGSSGVNPDRQEVSHPHMIVTTPDNRFAVVPDLGTDKIYLYALDSDRGKLSLSQTLDLPPGAGPRHVAFHPSLTRMYGINELDSTMVTWEFNADDNWTRLSIESTLPVGFIQPADRPNSCADVHVHPNGKFLYGSNRGHDSIVIFAIDDAGVPSLIGHHSTLGQWPRAFMIDPRGEYLIVGNRHTDTAVTFAIDTATGALTHRSTLELNAPITFKMLG